MADNSPDGIFKVDLESLTKILAVACGGAAGAVARYLINVSPLASASEKFPLPTFLINVSGSFLIGFLSVLLVERFPLSEHLRLTLLVGFLGAFTTFSTFEFEIFYLAKEKTAALALFYLAASVVAGFAAVLGGFWLARNLFGK